MRPRRVIELSPIDLQAPRAFEANRCQVDPAVRFLARGAGYTMFFTPAEVVVRLRARMERYRDWFREGRRPRR
jgi:hypothetical protein